MQHRNVEQTKAIGADQVVDYTKDDFTKDKQRYDLILAINGSYGLQTYKRILNKGGSCVVVGGSLGQIFGTMLFGWLLSFGSRKLRMVSDKHSLEKLEFVTALTADGTIGPVIERTYTLDQTPEAMQYLMEGHASGKVVIRIE